MLKYILEGGTMMIPLVIFSVLTLAVIIERCIAFYQNRSINIGALRAEVLGLLAEGREDDAIMICASTPSPVAAVMLVGLQTYQKLTAANERPEVVRAVMTKSMEDYSMHAINAVQKRLNILDTVGTLAPLLGMAGTVLGMIKSFAAMAGAASLDAGLVAAGISEALITTAAGLLIAVAAVIPLKFFTSMTEDIELDVEDAASELIEFVSLHAGSGVDAPVAYQSAE